MKKLGFAMLVVLFGLSTLVTACKKQEAPAPAPATTEQQGTVDTTAAPATTEQPAAH